MDGEDCLHEGITEFIREYRHVDVVLVCEEHDYFLGCTLTKIRLCTELPDSHPGSDIHNARLCSPAHSLQLYGCCAVITRYLTPLRCTILFILISLVLLS